MITTKTSALKPWLVVLTSTLFFFLIFVQINIFNAINPYLIKDLGFTTAQIGTLSACYFLTNTIFVIPAGIVLDRISVKKCLLFSLIVTTICTYVFSQAHSFAVMSTMRLMMGVVGSFCFISCVKLATRWFPPHRLALVIGLIITMGMLGGMVAQTPMTLVVDNYGWRMGLVAAAILGVIALALVAAIVRDFPEGMKEKLRESKAQSNKTNFWPTLWKTLSNSQNWLAGTFISLINLPIFMLGATWGSLYLVQAANLTRAESSVVISMLFIGMIIGSPISGWISDTMRKRKTPMIYGALLSIGTFLMILFIPNLSFAALTALFLLLGFVVSSQTIGYPVIAESNPSEVAATATSIGSTLIVAGGMLTPIFGWLLNMNWDQKIVNDIPVYSLANLRLAMMSILAAFIIGLIAALLVKETNCKPLEK